jgi:hypothetical protein
MNTEKQKFFDDATNIGLFLDDAETWSAGLGFLVCLNENDKEHQSVIDGDSYLRKSSGEFLSVNLNDIDEDDMKYLFDKYGCIREKD